jgi:hypothetical protein
LVIAPANPAILEELTLLRIPLGLLLATLCCALLACGQSGVPVGERNGSYGPAGYDPLHAAPQTADLAAALASAPALTADGFTVTALGDFNQPAPQVQAALQVAVEGDSLVIRSDRPLNAASLYVRYDAASVHPVELNVERGDGLSLALKAEPGLLAVGAVAAGDGVLDHTVPLARLRFAPGADTEIIRRPSISQTGKNAVTDLSAVDNHTSSATLQWHEQHSGDYNLDSLVSISDLTPLGARLGHSTTDGEEDLEDEVVDGNGDTLISINDLTPIGASFNSSIAGYNVYRTAIIGPGDNPDPTDTPRWTKVLNNEAPDGPSIVRNVPAGTKVRPIYTFIDESGNGEFAWYVAPAARPNNPPLEGPPSNVASVLVTPAGPPEAGLSFEIQAPANEWRQRPVLGERPLRVRRRPGRVRRRRVDLHRRPAEHARAAAVRDRR